MPRPPVGSESLPEQPTYDFSVCREIRKREGLTIGEVSERSGISSAVISKLERNQSKAELDTLYRLSRVFGMTATDLLALAESRSAQKVRARTYASGGMDFNRVDYSNLRVYRVTAKTGSAHSRPEVHRDDYELCWVESGCLELKLPHETHRLMPGEAVQFDAIQEHTYRALEDSTFTIVHLRKSKRF